ncbi:hypothetical protein NV64_13515 [Erwinia sp. B116]|nr:hypothetical protein ASF13_03405 [Erwinia sp. Leaf53]PLV59606.1 hypothetical protein NV64_13515 [Erwinia sp. B116]
MLSMLKKLFHSSAPQAEPEDEAAAEQIAQTLLQLETELAANPADNATQKQLMVKYNQAIKIYSAQPRYRQRVDDIFVKMDELRNTIRRNL